jgi:hypothetical protein
MRYVRTSATLFTLFALLAGSGSVRSQQPLLSASDVIKRIQDNVGVPWQKETVDTFKAGDPETKITGIAVTMMATFDVLSVPPPPAKISSSLTSPPSTIISMIWRRSRKTKTTWSSPRNSPSSSSTISSFGGFMIIGTHVIQTASRPGWFTC